MTPREIALRAGATAVQSFTAVLIGGATGLLRASLWQQAAVAGLGAVVTVVHRAASSYLARPASWDKPLTEDA